MNSVLNKTLPYFKKSAKQDTLSAENVEEILQTMPYFAPMQLLYGYELQQKSEKAELLENQKRKLSLYIPNSDWLDLLLSENPTFEIPEKTISQQNAIEQETEKSNPVNQQTEQEDPVLSSKLGNLLSVQLADFNKPLDAGSAKLDFEKPLYTRDYFESQGIHIKHEEVKDDQLEKQVLKFTDWLKKFREIKTTPEDLGTDPQLEEQIPDIAENSNKTESITTETMADVLLKQGKPDKAVQLYIKLSFLNPEKSAYFARKIQEIKGI